MRRDELAEFLRLRRGRTSPESVGLPANGRRRTPGLRREEISALAGVGLSWYTWLEQGRDITPSAGVLDALARVLDLDAAEHAHLFHLAGVAVPAPSGAYPTRAPDELRDIVAGLVPNPAYLIGPRTDVLAWNPAAARVIGTPSTAPDGVANVLWWMFTDRGTHGPTWDDTARFTLARFRAEHARSYGDPAFTTLIDAYSRAAPRSVSCGAATRCSKLSSGSSGSTIHSSARWRCPTCSRSRRATRTCASRSSSRPTHAPARRCPGGDLHRALDAVDADEQLPDFRMRRRVFSVAPPRHPRSSPERLPEGDP